MIRARWFVVAALAPCACAYGLKHIDASDETESAWTRLPRAESERAPAPAPETHTAARPEPRAAPATEAPAREPLPPRVREPPAVTASTKTDRRVAVLEFHGDGSLAPALLAKLSDSVRAGLLPVANRRGLLVMTRETMQALVKDMGRCEAEGECELETGRLIGADFVVTGDVLSVEGTHIVTLKAFDTSSGALLATKEVRAEKKLDLFSAVESAASGLLP